MGKNKNPLISKSKLKNGHLLSVILIFLAILTFFIVNILSNNLLNRVQLDLTQEKTFSLSQGTLDILNDIETPINLYFFYSKSELQNSYLAPFAKRVEELILEYQALSDGKIKLQILEPQAFSEAEDNANAFGLLPISLLSGANAFLGLAATNQNDDIVRLPIFNIDRERLLEYDISQLIAKVSDSKLPKLGIISSIPISGDYDSVNNRTTPPWQIYQQLKLNYDVRDLSHNITEIDDLDVLLLIQPSVLSNPAISAIEQFALEGGKVIAFIDPLTEFSQRIPLDPKLLSLIRNWGINLVQTQIIADKKQGLLINQPGVDIIHYGILSTSSGNLNDKEAVNGGIQTLNFSSMGILEPIKENTNTTFIPLVESSEDSHSVSIYRYSDLSSLSENRYSLPDEPGEKYTIAARISTSTNAIFSNTGFFRSDNTNILKEGTVDAIIVADVNFLIDSFWVRHQQQEGTTVLNSFADNAIYLLNMIDYFSGGEKFLNIRISESGVLRPFERVNQIRRDAESRLQDTEAALEQRLEEAEAAINNLKGEKDENRLILNAQQQQELIKFNNEALELRKELRFVRLQLNQEIDKLGSWLKFFNILLVPLLLFIIMIFVWFRSGKKRETNS